MQLKRVEARGGAPQTITYLLAGTTGTWGPDGTILVSSTASPGLRRVDAAGGAVQVATTPAAGSTGHRHPLFLPGGRQFLFFAGGPDAVRGVYLGRLGSPDATRLVASDTQGAYVAPDWLLFVRQGTLWAQRFDLGRHTVSGEPIAVADSVAFEPIDGTGAFSTSPSGTLTYRVGRPTMTRLSWVDRSGNPIGAVRSLEQIGLTNVRLSPDGRRVAVERASQSETDVWLLDSARQVRFTHGSNGTLSRLPLWSPDGARIAFESVRSGSVALLMKPSTEDGAEEVLLTSPDVKIPCDWSPDGRFLVYYVPNPTSGTMRLDGRSYPLVAPNARADASNVATAVDLRTVRRTTYQAGRATLETVMRVSEDGKTMTATTRTPDVASEPSIVVYERQD